MERREQQLDEFFNHYRDVFNAAVPTDSPDLRSTASLFANCFVAANPAGIHCGQNDKAFLDAMQSGYAFYKRIGIKSMDIVTKTITLLDDMHGMVKIRWRSNYLDRHAQPGIIEFDNIYFTQTKDEEHKVFAYITGDEQAALKQAGLI